MEVFDFNLELVKLAELMKVMTILHAWKFRANGSLFSIDTIDTMKHTYTWMCLISIGL